jgi:transposase-like protein
MITLDYPRTISEFSKFFPDEAACLRYLIHIRWPEGFICPKCQCRKYWMLNNGLMECHCCGRQISATSGTLLHGTRKSVREWFHAMWWISTQKTGGSARGLQRLLDLGSYQTAWAWLHKLKRGMVRCGRDPLQGPVEIDDAFIGGEESGVVGRQSLTKARIVVAVEVKSELRQVTGRIRMKHVNDFSSASLVPFVIQNVVMGSTIVTDGWSGYGPLGEQGFRHEPRAAKRINKADQDVLPNAHRVISLVKRWLMGTHHGAARPKHIQHYLDEFTFRYNRRKSGHVGKVFYRLVQGVCEASPQPYWKLVGRETPDKPLDIVVT